MVHVSRRLRLAPSLLSADFADLSSAIRASEAAGADAFHLDVMDGHFVPNLTFGPALVRAVRARTKLPLDIHLMIDKPVDFLPAFHDAGGDTLVFHVESRDEPQAVIRAAKKLGVAIGAAIRPDTSVDAIAAFLDQLDQVLVMSVHPGFSGQKFIPEAIPKLSDARRRLDAIGSPADISIDGGVTASTAVEAARAGATFFVCGNSIFVGGTIADNLKALRFSVNEGAKRAVR